MSLDEKIATFLSRTEAKPAPSKLEPFAELIRTLRQRRWTYFQIAKALSEEFGVQVHLTTIHSFVKVRSRRDPNQTIHLAEPASNTAAIVPGSIKRPRFNLDA